MVMGVHLCGHVLYLRKKIKSENTQKAIKIN